MKLSKGQKYDPSTLTLVGWTEGNGSGSDGYQPEYYFDQEGRYLGPDQDGIEPIFEENQ